MKKLALPWRKTNTDDQAQPRVKRTRGGGLSAYGMHRHLVASEDGVHAFYLLDNVPWSGRTEDDRAVSMAEFSQSLYELAGHDIALRGVPNPFPAAQFCAALDKSTQAARFRAAGVDTVEDYNATPQGQAFVEGLIRLQEYVARHQTRSLHAILSVRVTTMRMPRGKVDLALLDSPDEVVGQYGALEKARLELRKVNQIVTGTPDGYRPKPGPDDRVSGLAGSPMTDLTLGWLTHANVGMGMRVPTALLAGAHAGWDADEIDGFTNTVTPHVDEKFSRTTKLSSYRVVDMVADVDGEEVVRPVASELTRYVSVAHIRTVRDRSTTEVTAGGLLPFLHMLTTLPFDVNVLVSGHIYHAEELEKDAKTTAGVAHDLGAHHAEHRRRPDARQRKQAENATAYESSVRAGHGESAARFRGVILAAVTGESEAEVLEDKMPTLISEARRRGRLEAVLQSGQYASYRAFIPGEPVNRSGSAVQMRLPVFAAGMLHVDTSWGDDKGMVFGPIGGSRDLAVYDPHGGPAAGTSGLALIDGQQGSGKTTLLAAIVAHSVNVIGCPTVMSDPSDSSEKWANTPELAPHTRLIDMSATSAKPGVMTPSVLVPEPVRSAYDDEDEWTLAKAMTRQERQEALLDVCMFFLPDEAYPDMLTAVTVAAGEYGQSPWEVVAELERMGKQPGSNAKAWAARLTAQSELLGGRQIFPPKMANQADASVATSIGQDLLTIIKLTGIKPPNPGVPRAEWDTRERASVPLIYLAARAATMAMYSDKNKSTVVVDEVAMLAGASSFTGFAQRVSADTRKWNAHVAFATQNPDTLLRLAPQITNLAGSVFTGRMRSLEAATSALTLMDAPTNQGIQRALMSAKPGHWYAKDWHGKFGNLLLEKALFSDAMNEATLTNPQTTGEHYFDRTFEGVTTA